jgi:uncharacterized membrane protein
MSVTAVLTLVFALGLVCGLRSMTAPAAVCWGARLGWLKLAGSHLAFVPLAITVFVFTLLALGELVADKLPNIPGRNTPGPLAVRFLFGGICGVALCISGGGPLAAGFLLGGLSGIAGGLSGYYLRWNLKRRFKLPDFPVALTEDLIAVGGGLLIVSRF